MMVQWFKNLAQNIGSDEIISTEGALGEGLPKKVAVLLDFVQLRGGEGPAQIFCPLVTNCIYWVNLGMGRERETPAQFFWHFGVQKKWYNLSKFGEGGGSRKFGQNPEEQLFFEAFPKYIIS